MFLSFIVPVYNAEKYLDECLNSLIDQDISKDDYEIVLINDGSTDNSRVILDQYKEHYANISVIHIENAGVSNARNIGLQLARGDYIWMVDSDDFIARNTLSTLHGIVNEHGVDIVDFGAYTFNESLSLSEQAAYMNNELKPTSYANHVYITRSLFKRSFLLENRISFNTDIRYSEDSLFKCECLIKKPSIYRHNATCYYVRFRSGSAISLTTKAAKINKIKSWKVATEKFREYYAECDREMKPMVADLLMGNLWSALNLIACLPNDDRKKYIKELKRAKLFPFVKPKECKLKRSYQTSRTDIIGKAYDWGYTHLHTVFGFCLMRLYSLLRKVL